MVGRAISEALLEIPLLDSLLILQLLASVELFTPGISLLLGGESMSIKAAARVLASHMLSTVLISDSSYKKNIRVSFRASSVPIW